MSECTLCAMTGTMIDEYGRNRGPCPYHTPATPVSKGAVCEGRAVRGKCTECGSLRGRTCKHCAPVKVEECPGECSSKWGCPPGRHTYGCAEDTQPAPFAVGERVSVGGAIGTIVAMYGHKSWVREDESQIDELWLTSSLSRPSAKRVVTVKEWRHKHGATSWHEETEWRLFATHRDWTPTGRTHEFEVDDE